MDLQMTQVLDEEKNDDNDDEIKVGILCIGKTEHSIVKGFTKIGRNPALCQILVDDPTVSKVHAEIQAGCETTFISDVRSANGTKIKDVPLKPFFYYTINDGDAIYLGGVKATFKSNKSTVNSEITLPETPIPSRRLNETNTPGPGNASDFLFNNTSVYQSDVSAIPGTQQKGRKSSIFQEPSLPVDRRRISNRTSAVSASATEKATEEKKSEDDVETTDLHDLETQKIVYDSILEKKTPRSEKTNQYFDDTSIYDAETQVLSPNNEKKNNRRRLNDSIASSSRNYNSSSNFSRSLQISASPSPPPSPNPLDENGDIIQSQNLLEMCENPLLDLEKKANRSRKFGESSNLENSVKRNATTSEKNSSGKPSSNSAENITNSKKSDISNHVIAESDDESATDDDLDIEISRTTPGVTKTRIPVRPSEEIEDDSATDDEGHFESLAAKSPPKEERKLSLKIHGKTPDDDKPEENIFEAETQKMEPKKFKLGGAKFRTEIPDVRKAEDNIFDAETQQMDETIPVDTLGKRNQAIVRGNEVTTGKIDGKTSRMELKIRDIAANKKRQLPDNHDNDDNIFDAETQQMDLEIPKHPITKKSRQIAENLDEEDTNIFEADTQQIDSESRLENRPNKIRELQKNLVVKENIHDAETQQMELEIPQIGNSKKRHEKAENSANDENIFEVATQIMDGESPAAIRAKKPRKSSENREIGANIFDAATQPMDNDISHVLKQKKRRDIAEMINEDTDIDLLPTQVLNVATSTPVSRTRKLQDEKSKKSSCPETPDDLHSAATQIMNDWDDDIVADSSTEDSPVASPKLGPKITRNKKDKQTEIKSTSSARSPKSTGQKPKKSPRLETKNNSNTSSKNITEDLDDSAGKKSKKLSAGGNSSLENENKEGEKKNRSVNLDETLMRNLGMILDQEANNQELADEPTQLMTQNLVEILRPTQSFEEESRDSEEEIADNSRGKLSLKKKKKEPVRSPSTLGFVDGQAVGCSNWSDEEVPKATSTMREEKNEKKEREPELSESGQLVPEWLDPDSIFFGLPEVRISGTLSNPGSPCSSTTSKHEDFVAPNSNEPKKSAKTEEKIVITSTENADSLKNVEQSEDIDSPVVHKKSKIVRKRIPRKIIEDEDQDSDETFAYNELKKMADDLLANGTVSPTKSAKKDEKTVGEEQGTVSMSGRQLRHVRKDLSSINDADSCRSTRKLAKPSSSLIVSDFKGKREAEETTTSIEDESTSSSGAKRSSKRIPKATKASNSRSKTATKRGKESQEVEAILAAVPKENLPVAAKRSYAKVQLTRLDDSDVSQQSSVSEKVETPKSNRKRRATMSAKDVTPTASPAAAKNRRTISEGLENRAIPKEQYKIMLTGLTEEHTKLAKKLGGSVVSDPSKATVLITDKVRRTYKFLCAVARGLRVVSVNWLLESQKAAQFLDCDDFILNDPAAEKQYKFQLEKSLQTARTNKFLQGYTIVVTPKVNQPQIHELKGMIEASGGKVLTRAPGVRAWNAKTVIVSREEDLTAIKALLSKCPKTVKITVQPVEFILSGILRQEVNLIEHKLDIP